MLSEVRVLELFSGALIICTDSNCLVSYLKASVFFCIVPSKEQKLGHVVTANNHCLGRLLDHLSAGLYSKDVRFVMELVQNAVSICNGH